MSAHICCGGLVGLRPDEEKCPYSIQSLSFCRYDLDLYGERSASIEGCYSVSLVMKSKNLQLAVSNLFCN